MIYISHNNVIPDDAMTRGRGFIPTASMRRYAGDFELWSAQHKATPEDFIVEEKQQGYQCTVAMTSDFASQEALNRFTGRYVAVTLISHRMTTSAACKALADLINVHPSKITTAGNKDRTARTAQAAVIEIDDIDRVRRCSFPDEIVLRQSGFVIKDVRYCNAPLSKGRLEGNRFQIKLIVPGASQQQLNDYVEPRMQHILAVHGDGKRPYIPNFFWRQRLGRRQNLLGVGTTLLSQGLQAAFCRFMCETIPENDHELATKLRHELTALWDHALVRGEKTGRGAADEHLDFLDMVNLLEKKHGRRPAFQTANMYIEHSIAREVAMCKDFTQVITKNRSMRDDISLWVGAYQGYWFNQVLGRVLDGDIPVSELEVGEHDGQYLIPLYFPGDAQSMAFYKRVCPEAIPEHLDPEVEKLFLTNTRNRRGPRRPAFITVNDLEYSVHDETVCFKFLLRSGAYATNFLSLLFGLDSDVLAGA